MKVEEWISTNGMYGKVTLMYDHATQHSGYFISKSGPSSLSTLLIVVVHVTPYNSSKQITLPFWQTNALRHILLLLFDTRSSSGVFRS